jgi:hypothetical protein
MESGDASKKPQHILHHSIDRKHTFLHARFEVGLSISFTRKSIQDKKWHFSWGDDLTIFPKAAFEKRNFLYATDRG